MTTKKNVTTTKLTQKEGVSPTKRFQFLEQNTLEDKDIPDGTFHAAEVD